MKSLKTILFARYALAVALVIVTLALVLAIPLRSQISESKKAHLLIEARTAAALIKPYYLENRIPEIRRLSRELSDSTGERIVVIDVSGKVVVDSTAGPAEADGTVGAVEVSKAFTGEAWVSIRRSGRTGERYIYAAAPISVEDEVVAVARVSAREGSITPDIVTNWLIMAAGLAFTLAVLFGITFWVQKTISADLREIGTGLEKIMLENDLDRMPQPRISEVHELAQSLDTIAGRVTENYRLLAGERDRLQAILNNVNTGLIVLGADGKVDLMNPVAERILGVSGEDAIRRSLTEIHSSRAMDAAIERSRSGLNVEEEVSISTPERRTLRLVTSPIRSNTREVSGVICVLEDITSTRRLERMRRDFVANVSHELRTPVTNFRTTVDALMEGAIEEPGRRGRFLESLDRESDRLVRIIEDLLVLSRLESEEVAFTRERFSVGELIEEVAREKKDLAKRNDVELVIVETHSTVRLLGDRKLIRTACINLLDNAIKYNHPGGRVELSVLKKGGYVVIRVKDTGVGIPERDREKVFERFYRVDRARSRETGGTGLGLSIVKHVAETHGGSVEVESSEGLGSTFSMTLPAS